MQDTKDILQTRVGILGGGQLGKMVAIAAANWHLPIHILDESRDFPAGPYATSFTEGSFKDYDAVYNFGKTVEVLTIEIEHVNTDALLQLEQEGVKVHPKPAALNIIKDKGLQKQFYAEHQIPTSDFQLFDDENAIKHALKNGSLSYPFVQKSRTAGYDGRGVAVIKNEADLQEKLLSGASMVEDLVDIQKELAVIVARNERGEVQAFPAVEMEFHPTANLVEFLSCPADISSEFEAEAEELAKQIIGAYDICGLLAVELFLTKDNKLLVNEVAPRPHNSGHHTIESCYTSQFEQHLRAVLNLPLGSTKLKSAAIMVNLLGAAGHTGPTFYKGLDKCLAIEGAHPHMYGKAMTKPFRKMGHVTILDETVEGARTKAKQVEAVLQVISQ